MPYQRHFLCTCMKTVDLKQISATQKPPVNRETLQLPLTECNHPGIAVQSFRQYYSPIFSSSFPLENAPVAV